jgi:hypothetical protein
MYIPMSEFKKKWGKLNKSDSAEMPPKPEEAVQKPGPTIHSEKWDDCVREVQGKNAKANAYAVCTVQLGEDAFKSEFKHMAYVKAEIKKAQKEVEKMGIEFAGPTPTSLLARQDLEGEADRSEEAIAHGEGMNNG